MRIHRLLPVIALTVMLFSARATHAQGIADGGIGRPHTREGFWIGLGLGAGSLGCEDCDDRETSWSGNFKLGGTINPRFLLGVETNGWYKSETGVTLTYGNLSAVGYFYPSELSGFYFKAGAGFANLRVEVDDFGNDSESGPGGVAGLGYDVRVGNNFSLTPYLNFMMGSFNGSTANVVQAGLGLTWH
jgi:hypothetical protein